MRITMLGAGYVGLTTGAALAYLGHEVCCLDKDEGKIDRLKQGQPPLYEPHLQEAARLSGAHLRFTSDYAAAIPEAEIVFIAVGTPSLPGGEANLEYLRSGGAQHGGQNLDAGLSSVWW